LCLLLPSEELDIVDDEDIDLAVFLTELIDRATLDTRDIVGEKSICCSIDDFQSLMFLTNSIRGSLEEMCLPESDISIEVERIV
jgi:hypothetical protein